MQPMQILTHIPDLKIYLEEQLNLKLCLMFLLRHQQPMLVKKERLQPKELKMQKKEFKKLKK
jgi:hypothetical protein